MITFDKNTLLNWKQNDISEISVFFYRGGCAGTKVQVEKGKKDDFIFLETIESTSIFVKKDEVDALSGSRITQVGNKWIFSNTTINTHCGCGSSFSLKGNNKLQDKVMKMKLQMKEKKQGIQHTH